MGVRNLRVFKTILFKKRAVMKKKIVILACVLLALIALPAALSYVSIVHRATVSGKGGSLTYIDGISDLTDGQVLLNGNVRLLSTGECNGVLYFRVRNAYNQDKHVTLEARSNYLKDCVFENGTVKINARMDLKYVVKTPGHREIINITPSGYIIWGIVGTEPNQIVSKEIYADIEATKDAVKINGILGADFEVDDIEVSSFSMK